MKATIVVNVTPARWIEKQRRLGPVGEAISIASREFSIERVEMTRRALKMTIRLSDPRSAASVEMLLRRRVEALIGNLLPASTSEGAQLADDFEESVFEIHASIPCDDARESL